MTASPPRSRASPNAITLRILLYAPREEKMRRLIAAGENEDCAQHLVNTVDQERMALIKRYFHVDPPDTSIYHLLINTAIGDAAVVETIVTLRDRLDRV